MNQFEIFLLNCRERKEMSTGKAPKKNNYAQKNEMDLNFPTQFGENHDMAPFFTLSDPMGWQNIFLLFIFSGDDDQQLSLSYSTLCVG